MEQTNIGPCTGPRYALSTMGTVPSAYEREGIKHDHISTDFITILQTIEISSMTTTQLN
jgi:hypothetical protein